MRVKRHQRGNMIHRRAGRNGGRRKERPEDVGDGKGQRWIVMEMEHQRKRGKRRRKGKKEEMYAKARTEEQENLEARGFMKKMKQSQEKQGCIMRK